MILEIKCTRKSYKIILFIIQGMNRNASKAVNCAGIRKIVQERKKLRKKKLINKYRNCK